MPDMHPVAPPNSHPPTDLRRHRQRTERRLILGGFVILFVVGGGLVWRLYGAWAALTCVVCLGSGVVLFLGLRLILGLMEAWSNPGKGDQW